MTPTRPGLRRTLATLLAGSAGGQAVALAAAPLLARLYGPDAFAALGILAALGAVLSPLATLGIEAAIVLDADDREARDALGLCLSFAAAAALVAVAAGRPRAAAAGRLVRALGTAAFQLAFGLALGGTPRALVAGLVAGQLAAAATVAVLLAGTGRPRLAPRGAAALLRRHRSLVLWSAPQTLLNNLGNAAVPLLLGALATPAALGAFTLANRVVMTPAATAGEALRQALLPAMSRLRGDDAALLRLCRRTTLASGLPLALAAAGAAAIAPAAFAAVFGPRWRGAGVDAAILLAAEAAGIGNIASVTAIVARGRQRAFFLYGAVSIPVRIAAVAAACLALGPVGAVATHALLGAVSALLVGAAVWRHLGRGAVGAAARHPGPTLRPRPA